MQSQPSFLKYNNLAPGITSLFKGHEDAILPKISNEKKYELDKYNLSLNNLFVHSLNLGESENSS